jgi:protein-disulfide isomerase
MSFMHRLKSALDLVSTIVLTAAAGALLWNFINKAAEPSAPPARPRIESVRPIRIEAAKATNRVGDSALAIVEFSDFECPFCGQHARDTFPSIRRDLIEGGKVTYVSFPFPLERIHPHARKASEAAECAARQGHYEQMHERLFTSPPALTPQDLLQHAKAIGLDIIQFERCMMVEAPGRVEAGIAEGRRLEVNSTPTFFIGRIEQSGWIELVKRINGTANVQEFSTALTEIPTEPSGTRASLLNK